MNLHQLGTSRRLLQTMDPTLWGASTHSTILKAGAEGVVLKNPSSNAAKQAGRKKQVGSSKGTPKFKPGPFMEGRLQ